MKSHTSLVAQQTRLSEWAELVRDCQNRPQGMKINEWCQLHDITKDDTNQLSFREVDGSIVFFNEAEAVCDLSVSEPEDLELKSPKQPKRKGKKEADLSGLPIKRIDHYLSETELEEEFGEKGWKQLPDAISRKYHFVPAKEEVEEYYIGIYASKTDEHMVKADHPKSLLHGSLVFPSRKQISQR